MDVSTTSQVITFTARLTDDLSGVAAASVGFGPTGQPPEVFATLSRVSGSALDGTYQATVTIPTFAPAGTWLVSSVPVLDLAGNSGNILGTDLQARGFPTTIQVVDATPDTTPPQLLAFSFTPTTVDVSNTSQVVTFTARLTDDLSGVAFALVGFGSPTGHQSVSAILSRVSGSTLDGTYQATVTIPTFAEAGTWSVSGVVVQDLAWNFDSIYVPATATLQVVDATPDTTPPQPLAFSFTPTTVDVSTKSQDVTVTVRLTDDLSGVASAYVVFKNPPPAYQPVFATLSRVSGSALDGTYQATVTIPAFAEAGTWLVSGVNVQDLVGNFRDILGTDLQALGFPTTLQVVDASPADRDGDGIPDNIDNCPYTYNPDQKDSGGVGTATPDGIGDACQCGDVNNDGIVNIADKTVLARSLAGLPPYSSVGAMPGFNKCDVNSDGNCDLADNTIIAHAIAGLAPSIVQGCTAAIPH
jgi:hypothetical protein